MAHMIETMFSVREKPWHGLGTIVMEAPASAEALKLAGLDWTVVQEPVYTDNQELISLTCRVMPVYFLGITIFGIQSSCQSTFLALGQAKVSLFIALLRKVILLIPLAVILPKFMGVMGIYRAEPIADIISVITTAVLFFITFKKIMRDMQEK